MKCIREIECLFVRTNKRTNKQTNKQTCFLSFLLASLGDQYHSFQREFQLGTKKKLAEHVIECACVFGMNEVTPRKEMHVIVHEIGLYVAHVVLFVCLFVCLNKKELTGRKEGRKIQNRGEGQMKGEWKEEREMYHHIPH